MCCSGVPKVGFIWIKMALKSFHKYFGDFLRDLGLTQSIADQDFFIQKYDEYEGYEYVAIHVDDVIIADKNPSKYMRDIDMHFKVRYIADSTNYYRVNELVQVGDLIHISSKKYVNEILRKY